MPMVIENHRDSGGLAPRQRHFRACRQIRILPGALSVVSPLDVEYRPPPWWVRRERTSGLSGGSYEPQLRFRWMRLLSGGEEHLNEKA